MEDPIIGDLKQEEHGEVYVYAGKAGWRRVVTPEKQWNDLTLEETEDLIDNWFWKNPGDHKYKDLCEAVIAAFKEKNQ